MNDDSIRKVDVEPCLVDPLFRSHVARRELEVLAWLQTLRGPQGPGKQVEENV